MEFYCARFKITGKLNKTQILINNTEEFKNAKKKTKKKTKKQKKNKQKKQKNKKNQELLNSVFSDLKTLRSTNFQVYTNIYTHHSGRETLANSY